MTTASKRARKHIDILKRLGSKDRTVHDAAQGEINKIVGDGLRTMVDEIDKSDTVAKAMRMATEARVRVSSYSPEKRAELEKAARAIIAKAPHRTIAVSQVMRNFKRATPAEQRRTGKFVKKWLEIL